VNPFGEARQRLEPKLRPPQLDAGDVYYGVHETAVGPLVLAVQADGAVVACSYADEASVTDHLARAISPRVLRGPHHLDEIRRQLDEYLGGHRRRIEVPVRPVLATPFAQRVLLALGSVAYGTTTTYGAIAQAIGAPRASRAVGNALGANPVCIILPCHRVLRGDGAVSGYAGGPEAKRHLLELEGLRTDRS
jgi:methylated-DNA-[protein]-cysteine S-methyltransferase